MQDIKSQFIHSNLMVEMLEVNISFGGDIKIKKEEEEM